MKSYIDKCGYYCDHDSEGGGHRPGVSPINWVICGSESGHGARPMELSWAEKLMSDCKGAGVPFFMKQIVINKKKIDFEQFPKCLQVREMPK